MKAAEIREYEKISAEIKAGTGMTAHMLCGGHLHFGRKFTDRTGIYIAWERHRYHVYYLHIHGIESEHFFDTREGLTDYICHDTATRLLGGGEFHER